jgi:drug/metabolite transporter (DMT)-like permease
MLGWGGFWILTLIWGSLYLLSRVGLESINPIHLTFIRLGIAAVGLNAIMMIRRLTIPTDKNTIFHLIITGICGVMLPVFLLSWGLQTVESGVGSVLQATAAIFTALASHFIFDDERLSVTKFTGVLISFIGVIVLTQRNVADTTVQSSLEGQIAIILGALFYGVFTIHSRILMRRKIKPLVLSAISILASAYFTGLIILVQIALGDLPLTIPATISPQAMMIILTLALVQSFFAYLLYYEVVIRIGAAHATMVTYTIPPVALLLGVIFLNEALDIYIVIGTGLIFFGIALTKLRIFERLKLPVFLIKLDG